jgi:predicted nucleic acid-binding protein
VPNPLVVNAPPLIVLGKTGYLDLIRAFGNPVHVPSAVVQEVQQGEPSRSGDSGIGPVFVAHHRRRRPTSSNLTIVRARPGEEAVLAWALANPGSEALLDDQAARKCAKALGIPHRGCLGLAIAARQHGMIAAARPVLDQLRQAGLRLTDRIMNQALALVGE